MKDPRTMGKRSTGGRVFRRTSRKVFCQGARMVLACLFAWGVAGLTPASASTAYGDLNNFDVFNDTGQECHGFEIELDDVHSVDITYTFDWNHYGAPTIVENNSDPAHPKVFVRYTAKYDGVSFSAFTAVPGAPPSPTDGHMCTDPSVNIGCEHFGVGYYGTPSAVKYNWLIEDPAAPGTLIHGPAVNVATPSWTYSPPAPAQPAQVQAVILAPPPPPAPAFEFGEAVWVKAIVTTSHNNAVVELKDLVSDDPDNPNDKNWRNGEPDEVEIEWQILQTEFNNPAGANNELEGAAEDLPSGDEVVTRRYEFYKYVGPLDPETNEAKCDNYPQISDPTDPSYKAECDPASVTILGDYIGAQMAGFNVEAVLGLIDHVQDGDVGEPYTSRTLVVGGNTPYETQVTSGALPPDLVIASATGVLSGTPTTGGVFSFTVTATDADSVQVSKTYTLTVNGGAADLCAGVICNPADACHEAGVCDPASGLCSDPPSADGKGCDDGDACTLSDVCQAGVCTGGSAVQCGPSGVCHEPGVCDPATGTCAFAPMPDGTACDDGNACSRTDTCQAGTCSGTDLVQCTASDPCHVAGTCDGGTGACSNPTAPDGTACDDGNACTATDACQAGACTGSGQSPLCGSADLALILRAEERVKVGKRAELTVGARNRGPNAAAAVVATLSCSGVPFHVSQLSRGCRNDGGVISCSFGTLARKRHVAASVKLVPDAKGVLSCTAKVTSATPDPEITNQSRTVAIVVR